MSEPTPVEASAPAIIPTVPLYAEPRREFKMPTPGEWISAAVEGGSRFAELQAKIKAAAPDVTTGDLDGVMPIPVLGPVYNNFRGMRPIVDAIGARAMPQGGKVFIRPVVTTHTSIGTVTQGQTIQDGTFVVNDVQITKAIYGGYVELSEASIDWSSPEVLGALVDDMARIYANETDAVAATELATESANNTENFTVADIADPTEWARWMYAAAENILTGSNGNLPTHLFLSPLRWSQLGQLVDGQQRPLFPQAGPMNAFGSVAPGQYVGNAFGFAVVVDRNLTDEMIVGHPDGFECYEQQKGVVSIENPSLLARTIAFRGYFAPKMIDGSKFVRAAFV